MLTLPLIAVPSCEDCGEDLLGRVLRVPAEVSCRRGFDWDSLGRLSPIPGAAVCIEGSLGILPVLPPGCVLGSLL